MSNTSPKIKIVILVNELLRGGAQRIILDIAKNINRTVFSLRIVYLKSHENFESNIKTLAGEIETSGIPVTCLYGGKHFSMGEAWQLYRFLRNEKPDVLHLFLPYAGILGRIIGRYAGVKAIVSTQCNLPLAYSPKIYWLDKLTLFLGTVWTGATEGIELLYGGSVSKFSKSIWEEGRRHFTVVAGVDLSVFDGRVLSTDRNEKRQEVGIPQEAKLAMMISRMISWKGHTDLVSAMKFLPQYVHLALVGWGLLENELKKQARKEGTTERIHFLGARSDVPELLKTADVYIQAHSRATDGSIWMGPNTSQMEACAASIPSVSTAVPLIESLIEDGVTGVLAEPNNPKDLARAIAWILEHKDEAKKLADAARKRVEERYSLSSMIHSYESLYKAVTDNNM